MSELEQSDANEEQLSSEVANDGQGDSQEAAPSENQEQSEPPFHEHPRWKEVQEKSDQYRREAQDAVERAEALQERLEAIEAHLSKPQGPDIEDEVFETVKKADPKFGKLFEETVKKTKGLDVDGLRQEIRQELQQELAASKLETQIAREFEMLHDKHEVPEFWRSRYETELQTMANKDPGRFQSFDDMRREYEGLHKAYQEQLEGIKRETTKSYVKDKKSAASRPRTQPKGAPVGKTSEKPKYSNAEEMKADIVKAALSAPRGGQDNF